MRNSVRTIGVTAMITVVVGACSEAAAPVTESPTVFAYELTATGARADLFSGETAVLTAKNGHSEPGPRSAMVTRDYTPLHLAQPDLDVLDTNAYLAVGLIGPFDAGTFTARSLDSFVDSPSFVGTYSVRLAPGVWEHYEITGGTITLFWKGSRLAGTIDVQSKRVQRVNRGFAAAPDTTSLTITGRIASVPR